MILEDVNGKPKVKLYTDVQGSFKGEALVTYLQEASVELAVRLLDETELVLGSGEKPMSVKAAEWGSKDKKGGEEANGTATAATEGGAEASGSGSVNVSKVVKPRDQQKAKQGKKAAALRQCVSPPSSPPVPSILTLPKRVENSATGPRTMTRPPPLRPLASSAVWSSSKGCLRSKNSTRIRRCCLI